MIAIYARQSIDKKDSISIESQIEYGKRELTTEKFDTYIDRGYSGKNTNRPAFESMMKDVERGAITKVIVYRLDRISRSIVDFSDFIGALENHGTAFVSATEKFDTSTPMGRAMLYIVVVFAQLERETIAERVRDNYYSRVKSGAVGGGPAPYGFDLSRQILNNKKVTIYSPNADMHNVLTFFELYSAPMTTLSDLEKHTDIKKPNGRPWTNVGLSDILKNPAYVKADASIYAYYKSLGAIPASPIEAFDGVHGCILAGKRSASERRYKDVHDHVLALGHHLGTVDSQTFLLCQEKLQKNKQIKNSYRGKYSWLSGLIKCGYCGYSFSVKHSKCANGMVDYFVCSGRYVLKVCDAKQTHRVHEIEAYVEKELFKKLSHTDIKNDMSISDISSQARINAEMQKKAAIIDAKIENLIFAIEDCGDVSKLYINARIEALHNEKSQLFNNAESAIKKSAPSNEFIFNPKYLNILELADKGLIARCLIEKVVLTADGIDIYWK